MAALPRLPPPRHSLARGARLCLTSVQVYYRTKESKEGLLFSYLAEIRVPDYAANALGPRNITVWSRYDNVPGCRACLVHTVQLDLPPAPHPLPVFDMDPYRCVTNDGCFRHPRYMCPDLPPPPRGLPLWTVFVPFAAAKAPK